MSKWWFQTISKLCTTRTGFSHLAAICSRCSNTSSSAYTRPWSRVETSRDADGVACRFESKEASFEARYESRFIQSDVISTRVWRCGTQFKADWWYMVVAAAGDAVCYLPCCCRCSAAASLLPTQNWLLPLAVVSFAAVIGN